MAVGDAENDLHMFEVCGFAVAVANAIPELKQNARFVTQGERGLGVAELIDAILEGRICEAIEIRIYRPDDLEALIDLFNGSVRKIAGRDYSPSQVAAWAPEDVDRERWRTRRAGKPTWVAVVNGRMVGFIDLEPNGHIDMLFVHADHQRQGVASALMAQVEQAAAEQGIARLFTEASITAKPFFESRGFQVITSQTVPWRGEHFLNYRMDKHLPVEK